jgi:hypothetical protein
MRMILVVAADDNDAKRVLDAVNASGAVRGVCTQVDVPLPATMNSLSFAHYCLNPIWPVLREYFYRISPYSF